MGWFSKKTPVADEIAARKTMNKEAVVDAAAATDKLNRVFEGNGFTVKIAVAMGAKRSREVNVNGD